MKNPRIINAQIEGYYYLLPSYQVTNEGIEDFTPVAISFCRGDKSDASKPRAEGIFVESLLEAAKQRLQTVNAGELANRDTSIAITKIEEAIMWLEKRQSDRRIRGVEGTYQK